MMGCGVDVRIVSLRSVCVGLGGGVDELEVALVLEMHRTASKIPNTWRAQTPRFKKQERGRTRDEMR